MLHRVQNWIRFLWRLESAWFCLGYPFGAFESTPTGVVQDVVRRPLPTGPACSSRAGLGSPRNDAVMVPTDFVGRASGRQAEVGVGQQRLPNLGWRHTTWCVLLCLWYTIMCAAPCSKEAINQFTKLNILTVETLAGESGYD